MGKIFTLITIIGVVIMMTLLVSADITVEVYEADGNTPFDDRDIMVGEKLTIIISSDANDYWSGGLFISGSHRSLATLSGRDSDPNTRDYELSHYEAAGELAKAGIVAIILFILAAPGAGVIGAHQHQPAVDAGVAERHQAIGCHVDPHMFHRSHRADTGKTGPNNSVQGYLFVAGPLGRQPAVGAQILQYFGGRGARIS